jgi:MYXO-CTERM domain-containing protein
MRSSNRLVVAWAVPFFHVPLAFAQSDAGALCDGGEAETCDCRDNDCDGETDEPGSCYSASAFCSPDFCRCLQPCRGAVGESIPRPCAPSEVCVVYPGATYCEPKLCRETSCPDYHYCWQEMGGVVTCRRVCDEITCGPCQVCERGVCTTTCAAGEICVEAACVAPNCGESHCAPPRICCAGRCERSAECASVDSGVDESPPPRAPGDRGCAIGGPSRPTPFAWMLVAAVVGGIRRARRRRPAAG